MRIKSKCLVCRGSGKKLGETCLGCRGYGFVFVEPVAERKPEPVVKVQKPKEKIVIKPMPPPEESRKMLHVRASTDNLLDRILQAVEEYQRPYLESLDIMKLRPMILLDIAKIVGCEVPTVSLYLRKRKINSIPVKQLFSEAVFGVSNKAIRHMIKMMIEQEDTPLSDSELARQLGEQGVNISRRTVTKYRQKLQIPDKDERKKLHSGNIAGK